MAERGQAMSPVKRPKGWCSSSVCGSGQMPKAPDLHPVGCGAFASQGTSPGEVAKRGFPDIEKNHAK